jgi:copper resistance protein D
VDAALIIVRFAHFSAAMLLLGIASFAGFIVPAAQRPRYAMAARWTAALLAVLLAATGLLWFGLEAGEAGNGWADVANPAIWAALATGTDFGATWIWHLVLIGLLPLAIALSVRPRRWTVLALALAVLASLGLVGHAAMQPGAIGWVHRISAMLHLVAAGFWAGSLAPLLWCLVALRSGERRGEAASTLARFSGLGHVAVAVALFSGIVNAGLILGHPPTDFSSPYQLLLAIKIALVLLMIGIAVVNRYVLTPRLALRGLVLGTAAELLVGIAVVALVSACPTWDPV